MKFRGYHARSMPKLIHKQFNNLKDGEAKQTVNVLDTVGVKSPAPFVTAEIVRNKTSIFQSPNPKWFNVVAAGAESSFSV